MMHFELTDCCRDENDLLHSFNVYVHDCLRPTDLYQIVLFQLGIKGSFIGTRINGMV